MGLFASEFIESKREILNEKEQYWGDEFLLFTLNEAYKILQLDMPYCKEIVFLKTIKGEWKYRIEAIVQPIKVFVQSTPYEIVSDTHFFNEKESEDKICTMYDYDLCLSKTPTMDDLVIECRYLYMHQLSTPECEIKLPDHYMEALHNIFLAKLWEKNPKREDRAMTLLYKQLYAQSLQSLQSLARTKPRKIRKTYKKV